MEKEKAIQILNELIDEINQDTFDLFRWKTLTSNYMERLFVDSFIKKQNDIKSIVQIGTMSLYPPKNDKEKLELENKKQKSINDVKEKAKNFILDCVKEIKVFDMEENKMTKRLTEQLETANQKFELLTQDIQKQKEAFGLEINQRDKKIDEVNQKNVELEKKIPKNILEKLKQNAIGLTVTGSIIAFLSAAIPYYYNVGKDIGATKYEKSKYDLEIKVDSLTKQNIKILLENKQGQKSFDSLQKLYIQSKQK